MSPPPAKFDLVSFLDNKVVLNKTRDLFHTMPVFTRDKQRVLSTDKHVKIPESSCEAPPPQKPKIGTPFLCVIRYYCYVPRAPVIATGEVLLHRIQRRYVCAYNNRGKATRYWAGQLCCQNTALVPLDVFADATSAQSVAWQPLHLFDLCLPIAAGDQIFTRGFPTVRQRPERRLPV